MLGQKVGSQPPYAELDIGPCKVPPPAATREVSPRPMTRTASCDVPVLVSVAIRQENVNGSGRTRTGSYQLPHSEFGRWAFRRPTIMRPLLRGQAHHKSHDPGLDVGFIAGLWSVDLAP